MGRYLSPTGANFLDIARIDLDRAAGAERSVDPSVAREIRRVGESGCVPPATPPSERELLPVWGKYRYSHLAKWV
jgi:hypothetical protein